ncbi:hypothetical protein Saso_68710 [Streptomyces asoensis]|uniref:Uncharacterized protein n=1 Tax=Streptomyces asoensis TaxID=249586 RepID=A0ABQ3SAR1_9ACTN|nr:hypothetical protein GCM10010496_60730 [Streptomyces asoensis]GHI65221.1 hypothetical protein Saso_68710 [Streptomyces asoensis]
MAPAPLGDTVNVLRHGGTRALAFGIRIAAAAVDLIGTVPLFPVRTPDRPPRPGETESRPPSPAP